MMELNDFFRTYAGHSWKWDPPVELTQAELMAQQLVIDTRLASNRHEKRAARARALEAKR